MHLRYTIRKNEVIKEVRKNTRCDPKRPDVDREMIKDLFFHESQVSSGHLVLFSFPFDTSSDYAAKIMDLFGYTPATFLDSVLLCDRNVQLRAGYNGSAQEWIVSLSQVLWDPSVDANYFYYAALNTSLPHSFQLCLYEERKSGDKNKWKSGIQFIARPNF